MVYLSELVEWHGVQQAERPLHWGFVGDLANVEERLKEVVGFLRPMGDSSGITHCFLPGR